uniref:Uncharacterized protein n=1 Tax=Aegilops tauschii subsp. strangulata TaxID=200361 RepID=A0A453E8T8_AEGTS
KCSAGRLSCLCPPAPPLGRKSRHRLARPPHASLSIATSAAPLPFRPPPRSPPHRTAAPRSSAPDRRRLSSPGSNTKLATKGLELAARRCSRSPPSPQPRPGMGASACSCSGDDASILPLDHSIPCYLCAASDLHLDL